MERQQRQITMRGTIVVLVATLLTLPAHAHQVIGIHDGDTITLLVDRKPLKIRLANIDAPELKQPFGRRSKQALPDMCWGADAQYEPQTKDRYGRTVAVVYCNGEEANRRQVALGLAWVYRKYGKDASLGPLEQAARLNGIGLWADKDPAPPWEWRLAKRNHFVANTSEKHLHD
jgi:micrococcal nuclease